MDVIVRLGVFESRTVDTLPIFHEIPRDFLIFITCSAVVVKTSTNLFVRIGSGV